MSAKKLPKRLAFTDVETSGLAGDPPSIDEAIKSERQIIEYAVCIWQDGQISKRFEKKVMPTGQGLIDAVDCAAKGYNHFDEKNWFRKVGEREYAPALPWSVDDCGQVSELLEGETIAGSGPAFDLVMYKAEFFRQVKAFPKLATHRMLNTGDLAWPLWYAGLVEKTGLETLAKFLGVEHKAHTAMGDVLACISVWEILAESYVGAPRKLRDLVKAIVPGLEPPSDRADALEMLGGVRVL